MSTFFRTQMTGRRGNPLVLRKILPNPDLVIASTRADIGFYIVSLVGQVIIIPWGHSFGLFLSIISLEHFFGLFLWIPAIPCRSNIDLQENRCVILPGARINHFRSFHLVLDAVAHQKIVDPPSGIIDLTGFNPLGPP